MRIRGRDGCRAGALTVLFWHARGGEGMGDDNFCLMRFSPCSQMRRAASSFVPEPSRRLRAPYSAVYSSGVFSLSRLATLGRMDALACLIFCVRCTDGKQLGSRITPDGACVAVGGIPVYPCTRVPVRDACEASTTRGIRRRPRCAQLCYLYLFGSLAGIISRGDRVVPTLVPRAEPLKLRYLLVGGLQR